MAKPTVSTYEGEHITITYDRKLCIHAAECGRAKGDLFNVKNDPWCTPDALDADEAAEVVGRCPSGALTFTRKDGKPGEGVPAINTAHVSAHGPVYLRGDITVKMPDGRDIAQTRVALCRCGATKNPPFCDNSHHRVKFVDAGAVGETGEPQATEGGPIAVEPLLNAPLQLTGPVTIYAGSGRKAYQAGQSWLCRCGQSKNKPFCDGSHKAAGFEAPGNA